jgi:predicted ATPase
MERITRIVIGNLRSLAQVSLSLDGLTVLIGENGTGKSSIVEACALLHRMSSPQFLSEFHTIHRGLAGLLRKGASSLDLGVETTDGASALHYRIQLGLSQQIELETLSLQEGAHTTRLLQRTHQLAEVSQSDGTPSQYEVNGPAISAFGIRPPHPAFSRLQQALSQIEVHLGFDVLAAWAGQAIQRPPGLRGSALYGPTERLSLLGLNLVNAWASLKNDVGAAHWADTLALVRLGLGDSVESINVRPDPGGGTAALWLKRAAFDEQIPAFALSDGTLAWLAMVALCRLSAPRSLLVIDEPELHLHPHLLATVMGSLADLSRIHPVLIATQSDRLLDLLEDPAGSIRVCSLDEQDRTWLRGLSRETLGDWLARYGGVGTLRAEGFLGRVLAQSEQPLRPAGGHDPRRQAQLQG